MGSKSTKIVVTIILVIVIAVSFFNLSETYSNPNTYEDTIAVLDEKSSNVLALATSAAAISTGLTMIPGDIAGPIADEMADLSSTMMVILCAIFLEKYMLTLSGFVAFKVLIPVAAFFGIIYMHSSIEGCKLIGTKLAILGICLVLLVPISTRATIFIENTYNISIEEKLSEAESVADVINDNTSQDESITSKLLNKLKGGVAKIIDDVENVLGDFIEMAALMIVTSCVIPILTLVSLVWVLNLIVGINIPHNKISGLMKSGSKYRHKIFRKKIAS